MCSNICTCMCYSFNDNKCRLSKKEAEHFRRLLRDPETVQELDRCSGHKAKSSKQLTWDAVFRFLQRYVQKETESMQSSKSVTATMATRKKKMAEVCSLVKYFVRCANKRGPRLKCSELLKHVLEVLQSSYSCSAYGDDYSSLLLKDILSVRKYWCDITPQQWQNLLDLYCAFFNSSSTSINRVLVSRVIQTLVQGCCMQTDGFNNTLFSFFSKALLNARQEKHLTVLEHLISALNIFLRSAAVNCRMWVCRLGEELLPSILYVWADMRPSAVLKEEIIDFFNLQICFHHPKGAKTQDTGAHAEDWTRWQSLLYNLYDALVSEISHIGSRGKYVTGSRHIAVKDNLIELTADICHQLFSDDNDAHVLEVTQASIRTTQLGSPSHGSASKRRRIELGWEVLRDHLQPQHTDFDVIPWLQITAVLTSKYPSMVPNQELVPLLSALYQLLAERRRGDRGVYVLRCLREVARCQASYPERAQVHIAELNRLWRRVWSITLRGVSSPQTEALSLDLLSSIVHGGLINVDREFWKLFSGSACKLSQSAALCLSEALMKSPCPKSLILGSSWDYVGVTEGSGSPILKETLMDWLLMTDQSDEMEDSSRPHPILCRDFPYNLISKSLVSLTLKDTTAGLKFLLGAKGEASSFLEEQGSLDVNLEEIVKLYLQFSFNMQPSERRGSNMSSKTSTASGQFAAVPGLRNKLEQSLLSMADNLLNCYSPDSPSTPPECLVRCVNLLNGVLAGYISTGFLTREEACSAQLLTKAKAVAQDFSGFVCSVKVKMAEEGTMSTLTSIMKLCTQSATRQNKDNVCRVSPNLFIMILSAGLLNDLAEICKVLLSSVSKRVNIQSVDEDDHMDDDCETTRTQQKHDIDLFEDGEESHCSTSGTHRPIGESTETFCGPGAKSLLAEDYLAQQDLALLAVLEFLCKCSSVQPIHGLLFKPQEVRRRLLLLVKQMDFSKALHLHMELPAEDPLSPEEFDLLLRPLADFCNMYRQDQEICAAVLLALLTCIRSLGKTPHTLEEMRHVHGSLLQVVSGFCFLSQTRKCIATVRAALVRCLVALLEADPCCKWAVLTVRGSDSEENHPVSVILPSHLADTHHQVRMLVATSVERLFLEIRPEDPDNRKMLPLKHQQAAFENIYLKAQEGMRLPRSSSSKDQQDEAFNRKATLLKSLSVVLCCSPLCEKQSLFALFQSYKENNIEEQLLKKILCNVSRALGYRSVKSFVSSHLYYLVAEWLAQRQSDDRYTLGSFPYTLLDHNTVKDFYNSSYQVLISHLVFLDDFEQVKSIGRCLDKDWTELLADCFPKIMVIILPYFALSGQDSQVAQQRDKAHRVYDKLKDANCLGKQQIDNLIHSNLADIVVELLMTLYEGNGPDGDLKHFTGELDPIPNPPYFSSYVIKATLDYLSKCHSANHKSLVSILSKTPISIQRILLAVCERAAETTNSYERHRILLMYHLFVNLLLREVKDGLGGAWAFVLRDIIYTLIHHINSRPVQCDEVSNRSLSLCFDLMTSACQAALQFCDDALDCHLQVIVGTLTAQVTSRPAVSKQASERKHETISNNNQHKLEGAISRLEPFPNLLEFKELRSVQHRLKYNSGTFTLRQEITHFLSVTSCESLPLTRLEGLKDLTKQLHENKGQIQELLKECHDDPTNSVLVKLVLSLLQLCKLAVNHPEGTEILEAAGTCLGELGPVNFSTIALLHGRDPLYEKSVSLFCSTELQRLYIILNSLNDALTQQSIEVRRAAAQCVKNILSTQLGVVFWEKYQDNRDPMLAYLNPFRKSKSKVAAVIAEEISEARDKLQSQDFWIPRAGGHKAWLKALCTTLLDSGAVRSEALLLTRPLCLVSVDCCQRLLPLIIHSILLDDSNGSWRELLSSHIQDFFSFCSRSAQASSRSATPLNSDSGKFGTLDNASQGLYDKTSLRTMLAVIDYIRHQRRPLDSDGKSWGTVCDSNFWLELNYLEVAKAAQSCSAHFTALLYTEIYVDKIKAKMEESCRAKSRAPRKINFEENSQNFTISSLTENRMDDTDISLQELLIEVYRSIGEPDSLYGCGGETMTTPLTRIRTYEHEAMWGKALTSYDLHSTLPEVTRQVGIVEGLQNFGLSSILTTYMRGLESEGVEVGTELRELRFQAAWRNTQWDCELSERSEKSKPGFHESVFCSLQALRDKEFSVFDETLKQARCAEVEELCRGSLEAVSSLYPALRNLQSIRELESVKQLFSRCLSDVTLRNVCSQWHQHSQLLTDSDFALVEPIMAIRSVAQCTLMSSVGDPKNTQYLCSVLTDHLMELCQLARKGGNTQLAERAVYQMKHHCGGGTWVSSPVSSWQLEEVQVFWAKGEQSLALDLLRQMIQNLEEKVDLNPALAPFYTECLRLCGNWLAETCLESPGVILEKYLERAVNVIKGESGVQDFRLQSQMTEAFLSLARFAYAQYQSIDKYMNSSEFENKQALLEKAKEEVDLMKKCDVSNRYTVKVKKELLLDQKALSNLQSDRQRFLCKAVENYIQCLKQGEEHNTWVFRLASLWLENANVKAVNEMMKKGVRQISSHKFLPLMYQLAARMGTKMAAGNSEDTGFHEVLNNLISRASLEHPHHTLFIIFALVNANKDETFCKSQLSKSTPRQPSPFDLERSAGAQKIINTIRKKKGEMICGIERLCHAYITLAYMDAIRHKNEKKAIPIPADQPLMKIQNLEEVAIPTMEIKVDPSGCYDNLITVRSFRPQYHLAGGINLPKIIDCVGSDGKSRRQLVKGQDDLRQDAVMQQVFGMCSMLLQRNTDTRKRKLNIRRYKVVPFSQRSGVLEWCSGTVPIGEFLVDPNKGAHKRFRPKDLNNAACRTKMMDAQKYSFDAKLQAYNEVCKKFRPVFRYFCMERFLDPAVWMEKRLAYTHSVATSSIVGYIVGLGDRHIQNILIDEQTAELVHIDLGVAFEQGKILPTPETVPFRLSRDIVDGMGITGVEGVFRRCCEKTMEVMRNSQEALLTIVEVLLYDPLFDWTMNPLKAFYLQHDEQQELNATLNSTMGGDDIDNNQKSSDSQSFNKVAERVLLRLQEKLKGVEEGTVLSVRGQVNLLIQQAMDPKNLSRLFPGWQAWV
ncbi:Serine-protein kinase ATM [Channa argus]|uniref:non-specific serine/threonine protein kinase n=1 Tax=Channa argus TaxID=215402 RepID=A0A6G1PSJ4_CHAAH|nr:Serine-protein kinase ATM [Channa argus]